MRHSVLPATLSREPLAPFLMSPHGSVPYLLFDSITRIRMVLMLDGGCAGSDPNGTTACVARSYVTSSDAVMALPNWGGELRRGQARFWVFEGVSRWSLALSANRRSALATGRGDGPYWPHCPDDLIPRQSVWGQILFPVLDLPCVRCARTLSGHFSGAGATSARRSASTRSCAGSDLRFLFRTEHSSPESNGACLRFGVIVNGH